MEWNECGFIETTKEGNWYERKVCLYISDDWGFHSFVNVPIWSNLILIRLKGNMKSDSS